MADPPGATGAGADFGAGLPKLSVLIGVALISFLVALWATRELAPGIDLQTIAPIESCVKVRQDTAQSNNPEEFQKIVENCARIAAVQISVNDYQLRRVAVFQQYYSNPVLLWMVVLITISGVILAGLQLVASYQLAAAQGKPLEQGGKIDWNGGKLAVQSSVTGLLILAVSFAFFLVFVRYVYKIEYVPLDNRSAAETPPGSQLPAGGMGPAPPKPTPAPVAK